MKASFYKGFFVILFTVLPACDPAMAAKGAYGSGGDERLRANYDEAKAGDYTLPDPLVCNDGTRVTNAETWFSKRRPEMLESYRAEIYGRSPARPANMTFNVWEMSTNALGGTATRKQIEVNFSGTPAGPFMHMLLYTPAGRIDAPTFLVLNFWHYYTVTDDPALAIFPVWEHSKLEMPKNPVRGQFARNWKISETLARGYGIAFLYYQEIDPDLRSGAGL